MSDERCVTFRGEEFRVEFPVPPMALMEFAHLGQEGADSDDPLGLVAMYDLLESVISQEQLGRGKDGGPVGPTEWDRFRRHAKKVRATNDELFELVTKVISGQTERPTLRPSDSSDGPTDTSQNSGDDSSSEGSVTSPEPSQEAPVAVADEAEEWLRVQRRLEAEGRPDKALMVLEAHELQLARTGR